MSKQTVEVQEVTLVCAVADDGHTIDGAIAYKAPDWNEKDPAANLLCPACSMVVLDDRTGLQVKTADIRAMVAAMAAEDPAEATVFIAEAAKVVVVVPTPDDVEVVVPAKPRFCGLCQEEIPPEHPHALHSPCYGATRVYYNENGVIYTGNGKKKRKVNVEWEIESADRWLQGMAGANGDLDFSAATAMFAKATEAYKNGEDLVAVRFAFVAKDTAARPYVDKMYDYLVQQANNLRDESCLTDEIEKMFIRVEEFMGREWYIAAADTLKGNRQRNQSGAKHAVGKAWQTPRTRQTLARVEEQLALLKGEPIEIPAEALELYRQAVKQLVDNPWEADDKAHQVKEMLEPVFVEADRVRRAEFTAGLTFGARVLANAASEDVEVVEEIVGEPNRQRSPKTHRADDIGGDGRRRGKKQQPKGRRDRSVANRRAIEESALTVVEPAPA